MYLLDLVKGLFGHADITDPAVFGPDQHVEDKERERRVRGKSTTYIFRKYRFVVKDIFYLPCRCKRNFAQDRIAIFRPLCVGFYAIFAFCVLDHYFLIG